MNSKKMIQFYATKWCPDCIRAQRLLDQNSIPYTVIDINQDMQGREFVLKVNNGNRSVPTIVFPDGTILVEPSNKELSKKIENLEK